MARRREQKIEPENWSPIVKGRPLRHSVALKKKPGPLTMRWWKDRAWVSAGVENWIYQRLGNVPIGVRMLSGTGMDRGKFALEFVPWDRQDRTVYKVSGHPRLSGLTFFSMLHEAVPRGNIKLEEHGNYLVGTLPHVEGEMPPMFGEGRLARDDIRGVRLLPRRVPGTGKPWVRRRLPDLDLGGQEGQPNS